MYLYKMWSDSTNKSCDNQMHVGDLHRKGAMRVLNINARDTLTAVIMQLVVILFRF
jgi:hypothetical protein